MANVAHPRQAAKGRYCYTIEVEEPLDPSWVDWFPGMTLTATATGTRFVGVPVDQAALHGLLASVRDLNLTLVSVSRRPDGGQPTDCD